jgi:hypothetical protein
VDPVESDALAPAEPDESEVPVASAKAVGIAAMAEPTPSATANAPTRPTNRPPRTADQFPTAATDINNSFSGFNTSALKVAAGRGRAVSMKLCKFFDTPPGGRY